MLAPPEWSEAEDRLRRSRRLSRVKHRPHRPTARPWRTGRMSGPLKSGWSEVPYFAVLAVASISIIMPGQASAVMTRNVPAGCVTPPNSSVLHLPAGKK